MLSSCSELQTRQAIAQQATRTRSPQRIAQPSAPVNVGLTAVVVAVTGDEPRVLSVHEDGQPDALPAGPLQPDHRTLEAGLRAWVERQTRQGLGYVEQLYTFGDRDRTETDADDAHALSVAYLALAQEARPPRTTDAAWRNWYGYFPWEDWRDGKPAAFAAIEPRLLEWAARARTAAERSLRQERLRITFGLCETAWNEERVLERYELLYETALVPEAHRNTSLKSAKQIGSMGSPMAADHRRILATAIGRLRGKIKYRPVVFELMPAAFTLLQLQRTVETLSGVRLHKQNFRRLVEHQGLVEETGQVETETGGRPAKQVRFRRGVLLERPAPGVGLPGARRGTVD